MQGYLVNIEEIYTSSVMVAAESAEDAVRIVEDLYNNEGATAISIAQYEDIYFKCYKMEGFD